MSTVNYHVLPNSIIVSYNGKHFNLHRSDARFDPVLAAIKSDKLDEIPSLLDVAKAYNKSGLQLKDGLLWLDGEALTDVLSERIIKFQSEKIPFDPLIKFARKLRKNPSMNSREQLYKFLEHNGHPITSEGNFIAYRGVRDDLKDSYTGKFDNSPGSVCEMDRREVDDNPNNTCSRGLHVACYDYAKGFASRLVEVEVDPQDVVCVPTDYNGTKMRTCKFKVVNLCSKLNESTLVSSSYEPSNDEFSGVEAIENECNSECEGPCEDDWEIPSNQDESDEDWETLTLRPSEVVESATYQSENELLDVKLKDGSEYRYSNVPSNVTYEWEDALSTGAYYVNFIAHSYQFRKLS